MHPTPWPPTSVRLAARVGVATLALAGLLVGVRARGWTLRASAASPVAATSGSPASPPLSALAPVVAAPRPARVARVADAEPTGERRDLRDVVRVVFDGEVDRAAVEASFRIEPPTPGTTTWTDPLTLVFSPARLEPGTLHRVRVGGASVDGAPIDEHAWTFRTLFPPPRAVVPGEGRYAVLTFDDGSRTATEGARLLDLLARLEVPAILFPTGRWERAWPELAARAWRDGHLVCNHSATHANLSVLPDVAIEAEIRGGAGQGRCDLLRPPSMGIGPRVEAAATRLGYRMFLWDVDSRDWEGLPAEDIRNLVLNRIFPDAVVLFHMHAVHTLEALPGLVERLRAEGYRVGYPDSEGLAKLAPGERENREARHGTAGREAASALSPAAGTFQESPPLR